MLRNIWRYSHFALALVSSVFLLLATVTGLILALEPIQQQLQPYRVAETQDLPLSKIVQTLMDQYEEVLELEVDANGFVKVDVISMEEDLNGAFYINPLDGQKIGDIPPKNAFFEWTTNFHRSLFLKSTGRFLVGLVSFFLCLIALSGTLLLIKRQGGIRPAFGKIVKDNIYQYYHIILSRWMLIPVLIISLSGVYLSLLRFDMLPEGEITVVNHQSVKVSNQQITPRDFPAFKNIKLGDLRKLTFPFSEEIDDYFIVDLADKQLKVNQQNGQSVETTHFSTINAISALSFNLHTGTGSILWSLILAVAAANILFFMYSGGVIAYQRLRATIRNVYRPDEAEYIILMGSENGSTKNFGKSLQTALLQLNKKVFVDELNNYRLYQKMKNLVVLTSTYGVGDPPANANLFLDKFRQTPPPPDTHFSVVGFGSLAYPDFCKYALQVDETLGADTQLKRVTEPHLIHNQSESSFKNWASDWGRGVGLELELPTIQRKQKVKFSDLKIVNKQIVKDGHGITFTLTLTTKNQSFQSGDLLGIVPPNETMERWYSIAKIQGGKVLLSIKLHELGACSNYLYQKKEGETFQGIFQQNKDFHCPKKAKSVILIANGTGIAPYLGMWQNVHSNTKTTLYWGGKNKKSYELYQPWVQLALEKDALRPPVIAYSKESADFKYVQDIVRQNRLQLVQQLENGATIMICGAIAMQNDVLAILEETAMELYQKKLSVYQREGQLLMDCY
ncbi:MAG: PepSY domain-containing protein [Bacteroidota bacterium]